MERTVHVPRRRRRFWCPEAEQVVEAEYEVGEVPGFRQALDVLSCSAFEPPTMIACKRLCLDGRWWGRRWGRAIPARL